jgi:Tetratricopeptide repeat
MTPFPVDLPMARAQAHLAGARYPQALGAFRAAIAIDPKVAAAHLGLADALVAQGRRSEAVEGVVAAAEVFATRDEHADAICLLDKALALDPSRVELHLDLAMLEEAMGRHDAAVMRVEWLAERYMDEGRTDEAVELLRFLTSWCANDMVPQHTALITGATVIARNPLLFAPEPPSFTPEPDLEPDLESETTVAHVPSSPLLIAALEEPDPDSVTRIADPRHTARKPSPAPVRRPALRPVPLAADNPLVERLRARAGLAHGDPNPRHVASARTTDPLAIRSAVRMRPAEEDVTRYFPRPKQRAAS